mmetsp:Transcript_4909/g.12659  ORF Transcript_4909/g.12659 Transcript_4909/m.12659 type:complete len:97 (+) Transcript_4909:482-772(+)
MVECVRPLLPRGHAYALAMRTRRAPTRFRALFYRGARLRTRRRCCMPPGWLCEVKRDAPCAEGSEVEVRGVQGEAEEMCCHYESTEMGATHEQCLP